MTEVNLNEIEIGNELTNKEEQLINGLTLRAFDKESSKDDMEELKTVLKNTKITVIIDDRSTEQKTLAEIADAFAEYVEKGAGWRLKIKDNVTNVPKWIEYIINNPKNNDLAFLVQKLAELIEYQTAKAYTENELSAVKVSVDRVFGNQTRRALAGLKAWIENDQNYKNINGTYTGTYLSKSYVEGLLADKEENEKQEILNRYNLQYVSGEIQPKPGYEFIDPYSNNLAVKKKEPPITIQNVSQTIPITHNATQQIDISNIMHGIVAVINSNKSDIIDAIQQSKNYIDYIDARLTPFINNFINSISEENIIIHQQLNNISIEIKDNSFSWYKTFITINPVDFIDENGNYNKTKFQQAIQNEIIKTYLIRQYQNIPEQIKKKMYTISSTNVKVQSFIVNNGFNSFNILSYAKLDLLGLMRNPNINLVFDLSSYRKTLRDFKALQNITIKVKDIVDGNNVNFSKLKRELDKKFSEIIGVTINDLGSTIQDYKVVTFQNNEYTFIHEKTKQEFERIIDVISNRSYSYKIKNGIIYVPPSSSISSDKCWYKVIGGNLYKYVSGHNSTNAFVYNPNTDKYEIDQNWRKNRQSGDLFT